MGSCPNKHLDAIIMLARIFPFVILLRLSLAFYTKSDSVVTFTKKSEFERATSDDSVLYLLTIKRSYLVEFYSPGCGYCVKLSPTYKQVAAELSDLVTIAAIDCSVSGDLCKHVKGNRRVYFRISVGLLLSLQRPSPSKACYRYAFAYAFRVHGRQEQGGYRPVY